MFTYVYVHIIYKMKTIQNNTKLISLISTYYWTQLVMLL